jgi:hypothetical protein
MRKKPFRESLVNAVGFLLGGFIGGYVLDDSFYIKQFVGPVLLILVLLSFSFSLKSKKLNSIHIALVLAFVGLYVFSVILNQAVTILTFQMIYPLIFALGSLLWLETKKYFFVGLYLSIIALLFIGWFRFLTLEGGELAEHLLGYWGIKYTTATRNNDALIPLLGCILSIWFFDREYVFRTVKVLVGAFFIISLAALILTFARGAWISFIVYMVFYYRFTFRFIAISMVAILLLGLFGGLVSDSLLIYTQTDASALNERFYSIFFSDVSSSNNERAELIFYSLETGSHALLFGHGAGNFGNMMEQLGYSNLTHLRHAENLFLSIFVTNGFPVVLFFAAICANAILIGKNKSNIEYPLFVSLMVWLQLNSELESLLIWVLLGILVSALTSRPRVNTLPTSEQMKPTS